MGISEKYGELTGDEKTGEAAYNLCMMKMCKPPHKKKYNTGRKGRYACVKIKYEKSGIEKEDIAFVMYRGGAPDQKMLYSASAAYIKGAVNFKGKPFEVEDRL